MYKKITSSNTGKTPFLLLFLVCTAALAASRAAANENQAAAYTYLPVIRYETSPLSRIGLTHIAYIPGVDTITDITNAGDGRVFVAQRNGFIKVIQPDGTLEIVPFLDIHENIRADFWETGLLGLAFHPDYAANGKFYVSYTSKEGQETIVAQYTVSAENPDRADPDSFVSIIRIGKNYDSGQHNGGDLNFGPDGYLYISTGDGTPPAADNNPQYPGDRDNVSQSLWFTLGKILRIDVDNQSPYQPECPGVADGNYTIPVGNPFIGPSRDCGEIWAYGLRNPWRFSFDRATGDMYIGDVGEHVFEEIDFAPAGSPGGRNYGWHCYEGTYDYAAAWLPNWPQMADDCDAPPDSYIMPVAEYDHSTGACSVTGGFVYRGQQISELQGQYVFADLCAKTIWRMSKESDPAWQAELLYQSDVFISSFGESADGELYVGEWSPGGVSVFKLEVQP